MKKLSIAEEALWLAKHPEFAQRPATMREFLGPGYLDIYDQVRRGVRDFLVDVFDNEDHGSRIARVERALFTGGIGIGKGHPEDTPILTPTGWKKLSDLSVGDSVVGSHGIPVKITGYYPRGKLQAYKVTFNDGASVVVDGDHLWNVKSPSSKWRGEDWITLSTSDLIDEGIKTRTGRRKWHIPVVNPVYYESDDNFSIQPYTLGAMIGDGNITNPTPIISSADSEILDRIQSETGLILKHIDKYDFRIVTKTGSGGIVRNPVTDELRNLGLHGKRSHEKFIPRKYLYSSIPARWELLRGLMDTDGYILKHGSVQISTSSLQLAVDIQELVRSLGGVAKLTTKRTDGKPAFILTLNVKKNPFHLSRKAEKWSPFEKYNPARMIDSIEPVGEKDIICISVDASDELYVTKDFIVTHNTTFASIALPYMVHWVLCLKDPQGYYNLLPGSRIAFMMMSTSEQQAREVIFGDIEARIKNSEWFKKNAKRNDKFTKQIRFDKDVWIIPGDSQETTFEGYNILGGILDEADSHKQTKEKDYAEDGYNTILNRIKSRYVDNNNDEREGHRGLIIVIGQMKRAGGFVAQKYEEFLDDEHSYTKRMTIWESFGWDKYLNPDGTRNSFWYDIKRKEILPQGMAEFLDSDNTQDNLIEVPKKFLHEFKNKPEKALKDLAGIPPFSTDPFISMYYKVEECEDRYIENHITYPNGPIDDSCTNPKIADWFIGEDRIKRVIHVDMAYSADGDAATIVMGHVSKLVEDNDGDLSPYIVIDMLMRIRAKPGSEILFRDIRQYIYELKARKFRINKVTLDGFQSIDTMQQLRRKRIAVDYLSVDKSKQPYEDLREAIYEDRIEFPRYLTHVNPDSVDTTDVLKKELLELTDTGPKIDHPKKGSKDLADGVAAVVSTLMDDNTYRKGVSSGDRKSSSSSSKSIDEMLSQFDRVSSGSGNDLGYIKMPDIDSLISGSPSDLPARFR